jgi:hypothetical protein
MPELIREEIDAAIKARVMPSYENSITTKIAKLAGNASVTGAAAWARQSLAA